MKGPASLLASVLSNSTGNGMNCLQLVYRALPLTPARGLHPAYSCHEPNDKEFAKINHLICIIQKTLLDMSSKSLLEQI